MSARTDTASGSKRFGDLLANIVPNKDPERERPPHRWSYHEDDPRAQIHRPVGNGSIEAWKLDMGVMLQTFDEVLSGQRTHKYKGKDRLQDIDRRVLLALVKLRDRMTGLLCPEYKTIADKAGVCLNTAKASAQRLARWLGLFWVRRTVIADSAGEKGPQHLQTSNTYGFDEKLMPIDALNTWRRAMRRACRKIGKAMPASALGKKAPEPSPYRDSPIRNPLTRARIEAEDRETKRMEREKRLQEEALSALQASIDKADSAKLSAGFNYGEPC